MSRYTGDLVNALLSVNEQVPNVVTALLAETMSTAKQHEFGGLLIELGELLHQYAENNPAKPKHALRDDTAVATGDDEPSSL
ncbi:MAG: hypothetical protein JWQ81_5944 [Amycolatopsis sp.]|jgi:hypothetical protein|uniref:hypothetical protein n=1 Tax=Amycolatopsis sp. TaxID=37632 RepID=UPI002617408A|nr:hypothetical protein [Amycolatopsis sp.]MCU1685205.1 hypothetical protein [Amycolatopsis sp.]